MKQSTKKMTRGQMVYAPITTGQRSGKSPFGKNNNLLLINQHEQENQDKKRQQSGEKVKMIVSNKRQQQEKIEKERLPSSPPKPGRISSQSKNQVYQQPSIDTLSSPTNNQLSFTLGSPPGASLSTPYHDYTLQLQALLKQNQILRSREQIYVSKLLKLQQGLHRQHQQFMNLQQLYTQLFNVYKQKQEEFAELQMKYKATERSFGNCGYGSFRQDLTLSQREQQSAQKQPFNQQLQPSNTASLNSTTNFALYQQAFKQQLSQLIYQNKRLNQTNQKLITELNYLKSKHNLQSSKQFLETKVISQFNDTQKLLQQEKENKLQLQYQNKYLQLRNQDLEKTIVQLENVITLKQSEIIKIRQQKINIRKHSSQKVLNKSPPKSDSARSKSSNTEKKYSKLIDNLQKENHKLREENLNLKEKLRSNIIAISTQQKQQSIISNSRLLTDSHYTNSTMAKKLNFGDNESSQNKSYLQNALSSYQNENFNSQNINEQYFSFSRERDDKLSQEELPTFPMDLEIEGIIRKHEENTFKQAEIYQQQNSVQQQQHQSCQV